VIVASVAGQDLGDDLDIEHGPALGEVADHRDEVGDVSHAVLKLVTDA